MAESKKLVPKRRFKEFQNAGDWEQYKLKDVAYYIRGSFPQPYTNPDFYDEENGKPFVQVADIGFDLKLNTNTKAHISKLAEAKSRFVKAGKVIVALQGSIETSIGRTAITQYEAYFDRTILIFEEYKIPVNVQYFVQVIKKLFEIEKERAWGATISSITKAHLNDFIIGVPQIEEQEKLGTFFTDLDNLITLHQRKLDKIKYLKKAYLFEMFPAEGESKPKRRFKGFTDDWKQRKLGELLKLITYGFTNPMPDTDIGPWKITAKDVINGQINYRSARHTDLEDYEKKLTQKSKPNIGDLLITKDGTLGRTAVVKKTGVCINQSVALLRPNQDILNPFFLNVLLSTKRYQTKMLADAGGGAIKHIYISKLEKMMIESTEIEEQNRISNFFSKLDNLITLHQQKLDKLKNLKKSYLNEMFI